MSPAFSWVDLYISSLGGRPGSIKRGHGGVDTGEILCFVGFFQFLSGLLDIAFLIGRVGFYPRILSVASGSGKQDCQPGSFFPLSSALSVASLAWVSAFIFSTVLCSVLNRLRYGFVPYWCLYPWLLMVLSLASISKITSIWGTPRGAGNTIEVENTEALIVFRHATFTLQYM